MRNDIRYLIDAQVPGAWGGTGQVVPWDLLKSRWQADWPPLILAGGLTPDNVGEAIASANPHGVDVASGVESSPGVKDRNKVQHFIQQARLADPSTPGS
jgi:phosphoribosylanthranilate isomerase